jgi:AraC-like DNA-binding protein
MQFNKGTGSLIRGSHASENGAVGLDLTDSLAYLVQFDQDFSRTEVLASDGRFGAVGVFPESDSTLLAFVRQDSPPDARLLRLSPSTGLVGEEIPLPSVKSASRMATGNFIGGPSEDIALATRGGGVTVVDLETSETWFFETYGQASPKGVGDIDGDGLEELAVTTPERTWLIQREQIIGAADGSLYLTQHLYGDTYFGFDEGWTLIRLVPDRELLQERRSLFLAIAVGVLAVLAANLLLYWFFGPRSARIPTTDFYQYLVHGDVSSRTKFDHLVRIRNALEDHASATGFSVDDLAEKAGFTSIRDLNRAVKAATGATARTLIEQFRLNRAAEELASGTRTVEEVAASVGFSSHQYFTTRFKKTFGLTPSKYRAK